MHQAYVSAMRSTCSAAASSVTSTSGYSGSQRAQDRARLRPAPCDCQNRAEPVQIIPGHADGTVLEPVHRRAAPVQVEVVLAERAHRPCGAQIVQLSRET